MTDSLEEEELVLVSLTLDEVFVSDTELLETLCSQLLELLEVLVSLTLLDEEDELVLVSDTEEEVLVTETEEEVLVTDSEKLEDEVLVSLTLELVLV